MMEAATLDSWVEAAHDGDRQAFEKIVTLFRPRLERFCARMVSAQRAPDLTQDVFLKAYARLATYSGEHSFAAWLFTIARNRCRDALRRAHRREPASAGLESELVCPRPPPSARIERAGVRDRVRDALDQLPEELRAIVALHHMEGRPFREVAALLGIPIGTAKTRARRALERLSRLLREDAPCSVKR